MRTRCPECDGVELTWEVHIIKVTQVGDGRLGMHDVSASLVLGCNECSATVRMVDAASNKGLALLEHIPK